MFFFFFLKQKTAYEMRISDWSSDVCSSDLLLIITIVAATVLAGLILTLLTAPQYTAKSRIEVAREQANIVSVEGVQPEDAGRDQIGRASCRERVCQYG